MWLDESFRHLRITIDQHGNVIHDAAAATITAAEHRGSISEELLAEDQNRGGR